MGDDCENPILNPVGCTVSSIAQGEMEKFARQLIEGANDLWNAFFTSWITSGLDGIVGGATADWFETIALPVQAALLALGLMVAGIRIAYSARGEEAAEAGAHFLRAILVAVAGVTFFGVMQLGANALSRSILEAASAGQPLTFLFEAATFTQNVSLALIFGLFAVLATAIQWIIMVLRAVAISVLLPFWPVTAAGAMFKSQQAMFEKTTGWLLAFLLYGPVAAALYALAIRFRLGRDGPEAAIIGLAVFVLAIFALPALMKLVVPITSALGRASAGGMAFGAVKGAALATVAVGSAVATMGASAPASAAAASGGSAAAAGGSNAAASSGTAASSSAGSSSTATPGASGASGAPGRQGPPGPSGGNGSGGQGSGSKGSGRSGWDAARDIGHALPSGSRGVGEMIDE